jgi:hypothetical protein
LPLWAGILAGPVAWALDLTASYAFVKWVCTTQSRSILYASSLVALTIVCGGAVVAWTAFQRTNPTLATDGGRPAERARFMAILGLTTCALFALQILARVIPQWVLFDACQ